MLRFLIAALMPVPTQTNRLHEHKMRDDLRPRLPFFSR